MKKKDIGHLADTEYTLPCNCGKKVSVYVGKSSVPEYWVGIYVKCQRCGEYVQFDIPIN